MNKSQLISAFLNAVNTWKTYVIGLKAANKANNTRAKSILGKAMFYWRKEAEKLKKEVDAVIFSA
jgi:hypothetical protein